MSVGDNKVKTLSVLAVSLMVLAIMGAAVEISSSLGPPGCCIKSQDLHRSSRPHKAVLANNEHAVPTNRLRKTSGQPGSSWSLSARQIPANTEAEVYKGTHDIGQVRKSLRDLVTTAMQMKAELLKAKLDSSKSPCKESEVRHASK